MSDKLITGLTRGGTPWTPSFVTAIDAEKCIGCGRCYKVCARKVFNLVDKSELIEDFDEDDDDGAMAMTIADADDCIGCGACSRVCSKNCISHAPMGA